MGVADRTGGSWRTDWRMGSGLTGGEWEGQCGWDGQVFSPLLQLLTCPGLSGRQITASPSFLLGALAPERGSSPR